MITPKIFIPHDIPECEQINRPEGRVYKTPTGNIYPSVTTVLSSKENSFIDEWRAKVGPDVADRISREAARNGTILHSACESHLKGEEPKFGMFDGDAKEMYKHFIPVFDRIGKVHAIEQRMWSDKLRVAGTVDLIAEWDGKLCVIDWKSSRRYKSASEIDSYFMQAAVYAVMFWERTGIAIGSTAILMSSPEFGLIIHENSVKEWVPKFMEIRSRLD